MQYQTLFQEQKKKKKIPHKYCTYNQVVTPEGVADGVSRALKLCLL